MGKKLGPGKCVHCLKEVEVRNSDHLFPTSWYPDSTPLNLEKWQILSCIPCNSDCGKLESDFLSRVGLCLDPHASASKSVVETALRSMKYQAGGTIGIALQGVGRFSGRRCTGPRFRRLLSSRAWAIVGTFL
jgi:hypothetical protein